MIVKNKFGEQLKNWMFRWNLFIEQNEKVLLVVEVFATLIIVSVASLYVIQFFRVKSITSLENDEIYTIMNFSSQGVLKVLTDYHAPNNHIFFNLLNALTPIGFRYGPWQSRIWSILSISASLFLILYFFFRRKFYIEGALLFQLVAVNYHLMDNSLKARGYGLLVFFAFVSSLMVIRYLETFQLQLLFALSAFTILGAWTVPNYISFGGLLLLLLFVWTRRRAVFITGLLTLVITIGVYLPVLQQLLGQMDSYASEWGREFASNEAIIRTLYLYVLNPSVIWIKLEQDWIFYTFLFTLFILPALIWEAKNTIKQGVYLILTAVILLFIVSRIMETPTIRTISFVATPIFLVVVLIFSQIIRKDQFRMIQPFLFGGIALFFLLHNIRQIRNFSFVPLENWTDAAQYVMQTFPDNMPIYVTLAPDFLEAYMDDKHPVVDNFDMTQYRAGKLVLVDSDWLVTEEERWRPVEFSVNSAEVLIPQIRGAYQNIAVVPSFDSYIDKVVINDKNINPYMLDDRNFETGISSNKGLSISNIGMAMRIYLEPNRVYRSFYLVSMGQDLLHRKININLGVDGHYQKVKSSAFRVQQDLTSKLHRDVLIISMGNQKVDYIDFTMPEYISVNEAWAYPAVYER